jgi:hypothetical protein
MASFSELATILSDYGLGSLFTVNSDGSPGGWLYEQMINGNDEPASLAMALEQTPIFKQRYKVIFDMRNRANNGENVVVPTVQDVLAYEQQYMQVMSAAGVPSWFYDSYTDAQDAIRRNLTVEQISNRIGASYGVVQSLPSEVRDMFREFYGDATDGALVAAVLDPEKTLAQLDKATRSAAIAGFGAKQNVVVSKEQAESYADLNKSIAQSQTDIGQVASLKDLATSTMGESGTQLAGDVAFQAGAMDDASATKQLEDRLLGRQLKQRDAGGGAFVGQSGTTGLGGQR